MSITISSTTDSQAEVNAAAGIEAVEEPKTPPPAENTPRPQEDPDQDPDDDDDGEEEEQPEKPEQPPVPKKKGGWLRKIEGLERDKGYAARYIQELEQTLAQYRAGAPGQQQQQNGHQPQQAPDGRPSQEQFETYEAYVEALTDWKVNARLETERRQYAAWMQQQQEQQTVQSFQQRAAEYNSKVAPDYFEAMANVEHIPVSPALKIALVESEIGHQVAYELAKNPAELARITRLAPVHVAREVGKIEARIEARSAPEPQQRIMPSKAPAPIRPVGQGANGGASLKLSDDMPYQDWKRVREKQIAAAKRR